MFVISIGWYRSPNGVHHPHLGTGCVHDQRRPVKNARNVVTPARSLLVRRDARLGYGAGVMVEKVTRDVTARGVRMRVVEAGSGRPVILIHDFLVSHLEFENVLEP